VILDEEDGSVLRIRALTGLTLEFEKAFPYGPDDLDVSGILVRATSDHFQVEQQAILFGTGGLGRFFRSLYDNFRGWSGERVWRSPEDELQITARHDGNVHLHWSMTNRLYDEDSWTFSVTTHHGAGEDMRRLADAFEELLNPPE
jgi:hypothetical protein